MYISREVDAILYSWKMDSKRKPILLRGVRQCGKTSTVRALAESFDHYIEVNLEKQPGLSVLFEGDLDVKRILVQLELSFGQQIIPGKTLLFIDEIQECPRAITALRYFYEDVPELHVIAAGSLLEFVLNSKKKSKKVEFPVGRVRSIYMYPLSFMEFLKGTRREMLADYLSGLDLYHEENLAHKQLLTAYKEFLIVGGMPEAVSVFSETGSLLLCQNVHRDILTNMKDDFNKYDSAVPADILRKVFDYAIHHVCKQTKASSAIPGVSGYYFEECIQLFRRAGLVYPVKASPCDTIPFGATEKEANKKLLAFDTGIYLTECGLDVSTIFSTDIFDEMNRGDVVEMQTGLEIIKSASPMADAALFYWYRSGANAETDYVISIGSNAVPVEVKASHKGSMQSMRSFLETHTNAFYGIRVSLENFVCYENICVFPVYAVNRISETSKRYNEIHVENSQEG
ncbi:MAG: ATP-binding protein [Lachnospiraceae bacterium]|nr:ATP-binding protein [Lachnospiraceae bacterium]